MTRNRLFLLSELQRQTTHQACRALSACLGKQTEAERALSAGIRAVAHETALAMRSAEDVDVEAFAAWLREGQECVQRAENRVGAAMFQVVAARAALHSARTAAALTANLVDRRRRPPRAGTGQDVG